MDTAAREPHAGVVDGPDGLDGGEEELLDAGPRRSSRWAALAEDGHLPQWLQRVRRAVIVAAALAVVVVGVRAVSQPRQSTTPVAAPSGVVVAPVRIGPIDGVRALAEMPGQLTDYVRVDTPSGTCPLVAMGRSPVGAVLHAERTILGVVRLLDSRRTIDQATGLCDLAVRSRLHDVVITVSITPHSGHGYSPDFDSLETGADTVGGLTVQYAQMISHDRWRVVVGATGPVNDLPGSQPLLNLAQARGMLW